MHDFVANLVLELEYVGIYLDINLNLENFPDLLRKMVGYLKCTLKKYYYSPDQRDLTTFQNAKFHSLFLDKRRRVKEKHHAHLQVNWFHNKKNRVWFDLRSQGFMIFIIKHRSNFE